MNNAREFTEDLYERNSYCKQQENLRKLVESVGAYWRSKPTVKRNGITVPRDTIDWSHSVFCSTSYSTKKYRNTNLDRLIFATEGDEYSSKRLFTDWSAVPIDVELSEKQYNTLLSKFDLNDPEIFPINNSSPVYNKLLDKNTDLVSNLNTIVSKFNNVKKYGITLREQRTLIKAIQPMLEKSFRNGIQRMYAKVNIESLRYHLSFLISDKHFLQCAHFDLEENHVKKYGKNNMFLCFFPLTEHGMYLQAFHKDWEKKHIFGEPIFIPKGSILIAPCDFVHAGGLKSDLGGNPRMHFYIYINSAQPPQIYANNWCYHYYQKNNLAFYRNSPLLKLSGKLRLVFEKYNGGTYKKQDIVLQSEYIQSDESDYEEDVKEAWKEYDISFDSSIYTWKLPECRHHFSPVNESNCKRRKEWIHLPRKKPL